MTKNLADERSIRISVVVLRLRYLPQSRIVLLGTLWHEVSAAVAAEGDILVVRLVHPEQQSAAS